MAGRRMKAARNAVRITAVGVALLGYACLLHVARAQHTTLFTSLDAGGVRESPWAGIIAYTSFEESELSSTALGGGSLYTDQTVGAACNEDHELAANAGGECPTSVQPPRVEPTSGQRLPFCCPAVAPAFSTPGG